MGSAKIFYPSERKILLIISFLMCLFYCAHLTDSLLGVYNSIVAAEEWDAMKLAEDPAYVKSLTFICPARGGTPWWLALQLQWITGPIIFFIFFYAKKVKFFIVALLINSITFWGYYSWMMESYRSRRYTNLGDDIPFGDILLSGSSLFEPYLFLFVSLLLILQLFFLARFVMKKFNAKLPLA